MHFIESFVNYHKRISIENHITIDSSLECFTNEYIFEATLFIQTYVNILKVEWHI